MKSKTKELDVDLIGDQGISLTKKEEEAISNFIKLKKEKRLRKMVTNTSRPKEKLT
uniref:hypothetical protein n=1 Tax=Roseivirga sp. TaxID=1964215 RepID=UPI004048B3A4